MKHFFQQNCIQFPLIYYKPMFSTMYYTDYVIYGGMSRFYKCPVIVVSVNILNW